MKMVKTYAKKSKKFSDLNVEHGRKSCGGTKDPILDIYIGSLVVPPAISVQHSFKITRQTGVVFYEKT